MDINIQSRYDAFFNAYEITDEYKKMIDDLFVKIREFSKTCSDAADFETKFMSSPLNQEYTDLFVKVTQNCKMKEYKTDDRHIKSTGEQVLDEVSSDAKLLTDDLTMPARRQARMKMESKLRDTPLGKVEQASNMFYLFKKFKKPKKTDESTEE